MSDLNIKENAKTLLTMIKDDDIHYGQAFYMLYNAIQNQTDDEAAKEFCGRFDSPLEAIGIVMRETDFSFSPSGKVCEFPERYHAWFMGNLGEATIPADSEGSLTGDNILNTLKEGK